MKKKWGEDLNEHLEVISRIKEKIANNGGGRLIYLTISGSHLYGFPSRNSDIDYRGCYQADTNQFLGLRQPKDVIDIKVEDNDICLFEIKKEIGLSLNSNCNVLEHINSNPILSTAEFLRMKQLINNAYGKNGLYNSYKGMATFNYKKFCLQGRNTVKKYLYVFRGLMAGTYALQTGQIQPNITKLNSYFKIPVVDELVHLKQGNEEEMPLPPDLDTGIIENEINNLFRKIDEAYNRSKIPDNPDPLDIQHLDEFLRATRKEMMR